MTQLQVQQMTNPELNRALAVLMGWRVSAGNHAVWSDWYELKQNGTFRHGGLNEECAWDYAPDYCTDPAASLEVQTAAINADYKAYILNLGELVRKGRDTLDEMIMDLLTASPRERAEAAYITLQGVQNGQNNC